MRGSSYSISVLLPILNSILGLTGSQIQRPSQIFAEKEHFRWETMENYGTVNGMWNLHFLKVKNAESNKNEFLSRPVSRENRIWKWIPNPFRRSQKSVRKGEETVPTRLKRFYTNIYSSRRILKIWPEIGIFEAFSILNILKTKRKSWFDFPHALKPFNFGWANRPAGGVRETFYDGTCSVATRVTNL